MTDFFPDPINEPLHGIVDGTGRLVIRFGPQFNNTWTVGQVSLEMPTAPVGATAEVRYMGSLVTNAPSARKASASGDPPIFLRGGETMTVEWTGCTPGHPGRVLVIYRKGLY